MPESPDPPPAPPAGPRVIARFRPQAWINEEAVFIDGGQQEFDVTDQIAALDRAAALAIADGSAEADALAEAAGLLEDHDGPFEVEVRDAITAYFQAQVTPATVRAYIQPGPEGGRCPFCGQADFATDRSDRILSYDTEWPLVSTEVCCGGCGRTWYEVYRLCALELPDPVTEQPTETVIEPAAPPADEEDPNETELIASLVAAAEAAEEDALDDLVHDACGNEAAAINNGGPEDQVRYLLGYGVSAATILQALQPPDDDSEETPR